MSEYTTDPLDVEVAWPPEDPGMVAASAAGLAMGFDMIGQDHLTREAMIVCRTYEAAVAHIANLERIIAIVDDGGRVPGIGVLTVADEHVWTDAAERGADGGA